MEHALDDKGRLVVPARFRERLGARFIVTIAAPEPCLALYPQPTWEAFCERLDGAAHKDEQFRRFVRYVFANTEETGCDGQGRLLIPAGLRSYAGIDRDAVSIGTLSRVEVWAQERLEPQNPSPGDAAVFAAELGLY